MADALVSLVSSVVGGLLVLSGTFLTKRSEDRRAWLIRLQEAAGILATSYLQEVALINDTRRAGSPKPIAAPTTYVVDRQRALGQFRTLPWSSEFEPQRQAMGQTLQSVWVAWDGPDDEFQNCHDQARAAVVDFMEAIGRHIARRGAAL